MEHIEKLQRLNINVSDILEDHLVDVFLGNLKDNFQHEVLLWERNLLENVFKVTRKVDRKITATRRYITHNYKDGSVVVPSFPHPTRLTLQKLEEKKRRRALYNCDS